MKYPSVRIALKIHTHTAYLYIRNLIFFPFFRKSISFVYFEQKFFKLEPNKSKNNKYMTTNSKCKQSEFNNKSDIVNQT